MSGICAFCGNPGASMKCDGCNESPLCDLCCSNCGDFSNGNSLSLCLNCNQADVTRTEPSQPDVARCASCQSPDFAFECPSHGPLCTRCLRKRSCPLCDFQFDEFVQLETAMQTALKKQPLVAVSESDLLASGVTKEKLATAQQIQLLTGALIGPSMYYCWAVGVDFGIHDGVVQAWDSSTKTGAVSLGSVKVPIGSVSDNLELSVGLKVSFSLGFSMPATQSLVAEQVYIPWDQQAIDMLEEYVDREFANNPLVPIAESSLLAAKMTRETLASAAQSKLLTKRETRKGVFYCWGAGVVLHTGSVASWDPVAKIGEISTNSHIGALPPSTRLPIGSVAERLEIRVGFEVSFSLGFSNASETLVAVEVHVPWEPELIDSLQYALEEAMRLQPLVGVPESVLAPTCVDETLASAKQVGMIDSAVCSDGIRRYCWGVGVAPLFGTVKSWNSSLKLGNLVSGKISYKIWSVAPGLELEPDLEVSFSLGFGSDKPDQRPGELLGAVQVHVPWLPEKVEAMKELLKEAFKANPLNAVSEETLKQRGVSRTTLVSAEQAEVIKSATIERRTYYCWGWGMSLMNSKAGTVKTWDGRSGVVVTPEGLEVKIGPGAASTISPGAHVVFNLGFGSPPTSTLEALSVKQSVQHPAPPTPATLANSRATATAPAKSPSKSSPSPSPSTLSQSKDFPSKGSPAAAAPSPAPKTSPAAAAPSPAPKTSPAAAAPSTFTSAEGSTSNSASFTNRYGWILEPVKRSWLDQNCEGSKIPYRFRRT
eukprot:TRINITY_DN1616_c0_g1_i1.p1 TRINITY_DN1616_c0_g1~~TRINITY_DN1616_c0_g1_i1.p1  ORF type:complete len:776 (-),score=122.15 TRINITY_DN1616_c0_g1_i1:108-2408(-)